MRYFKRNSGARKINNTLREAINRSKDKYRVIDKMTGKLYIHYHPKSRMLITM